MINMVCHICGADLLIDCLETGERAGWRRSSGGWLCESFDCYNMCDHKRLGLHQETEEQAVSTP